ncbi:MAG: glycosyltransferase [Flavisolibacter sp.]
MKTKILELDITQDISPLFFEEGYHHYRVLVRRHKQPLGWVSLTSNRKGRLDPPEIKEIIRKQIGTSLIQEAFREIAPESKVSTAPSYLPISVVVCTRNRTTQLADCLKHLLALDYPTYEIIVVDNAPGNENTLQLASTLPVRYVREDRPGLDWARNCGIREAQHEIIAFTDDDVRVDAYWLRAIAEIFSKEAVAGASGWVGPAELETRAQHLFEWNYGGMGHGFQQRSFKKEILTRKGFIWASNFGIGANMAFRKKVFEEIGGFEPALDVGTPSHGGGDVEMFHRLVARGHLFLYEPSMVVWHYHRREDRALRRQIFDNGRGFGCYLIHCFRNRTVSRPALIAFFFVDWFWHWNARNLLGRRPAFPRSLSFWELYGMLTSPLAYIRSRARARSLAGK